VVLDLNDEIQSVPSGQTITMLPGASGGVQTTMALSGGVVYVPIVDAAAQFSATGVVSDDTNAGIGEMDALDVNTGQILWVSHFNAPDGSTTVSNDLVFTATYAGQVLALDRTSGHQVWSWQASGGVISPLTVVGNTVLVPVGLALVLVANAIVWTRRITWPIGVLMGVQGITYLVVGWDVGTEGLALSGLHGAAYYLGSALLVIWMVWLLIVAWRIQRRLPITQHY
jgi:hypothetical protein